MDINYITNSSNLTPTSSSVEENIETSHSEITPTFNRSVIFIEMTSEIYNKRNHKVD